MFEKQKKLEVKDDVIRTREDLERAIPGIPIFEVGELPRLPKKEVDEVMREYGDGTAQGES